MKHLQLEDLERLTHEMGASTENSDEWAESVGLDPQLLDSVGNIATNMAHDKTVAMARQVFEESGIDPEEVPEDGMSVGMKMDIGDVIKEACISMFALGFETHRQFGGADAPGGE